MATNKTKKAQETISIVKGDDLKTTANKKEEKVMQNSEKKNQTVEEILSVSELRKAFIEAGIIPKFCDNKHYVGCGVRANVFSVNVLKTRYNVYCSDEAFALISEGEGVKKVEGGNNQDKTRSNLIEVTTTKALKAMLGSIKTGLAGVAI